MLSKCTTTTLISSVTALICVSLSRGDDHDCLEITGIGNNENDLYTVADLSDLPVGTIWWDGIMDIGITYGFPTAEQEAAIQFWDAFYTAIQQYQTLVPYQEVGNDLWARHDVIAARRYCQPDSNNETEVELFELHQRVAWAYTLHFWYYYRRRATLTYFEDLAINTWKLNLTVCLTSVLGCEDDTSTPWGLAYAVALEMEYFKAGDGWNFDGSYNKEYNKIPFSDFRSDETRYVPVNDPWNIYDINRWQPLLESDNVGFLYFQEHSVPYIGYTGKSFFFSNDEICERETYDPEYDYELEMNLAIERLANLDDLQKMEIEYFDQKFGSLLPLFLQLYEILGVSYDSWEFNIPFIISLFTPYEATIAVWKAKVDHDRIRPPSIIHELLAGQQITSYAGTSEDGESNGVKTYDAKDWEPYIRTMPHAEYPSGSACVCEAFAQGLIEFYGTDNITEITGGTPLTATFGAFSSQYEPLSTPSEDIEIEFYTFSQISQRCAESRLNGGMHFTESIHAGKELCGDIGRKVTQRFLPIVNGGVGDFIVTFDNTVVERDCYPDKDDDSKDSKDSKDSSDDSDDDDDDGKDDKSGKDDKYSGKVGDSFEFECSNVINKNNICDDMPCDCSDVDYDSCDICKEGDGCIECKEGYFRKNGMFQCLKCKDIFGDNCKECGEGDGCLECEAGSERVFSQDCGLYYCHDL